MRNQLIVVVRINGRNLKAKIDTGSDRTTIDRKTALELGLGPVIDTVRVEGESRDVVVINIGFGSRKYTIRGTLSNRSTRNVSVLLGMDFVQRSGLERHIREWLEP